MFKKLHFPQLQEPNENNNINEAVADVVQSIDQFQNFFFEIHQLIILRSTFIARH